MKKYVVGFAFVGREVLVIRKQRPEWQRGKLNGIGGHIEPTDASPVHAMVREFEEETGCRTHPSEWTHFATLEGNDSDPARRHTESGAFVVFFFRMDLPIELVHLITSPTDERVEWTSLHAATMWQTPVVPNLRWLIPLACFKHDADWPLRIQERCG